MRRFLCVTALVFSGSGAFADRIILRADSWCPYNCEPGSDAPGFMVEIAREALGMHGHDVIYETVTWARALEMARTGQAAGAIGAVPDEAPELVYGDPIGTYEDAVAVRRGETLDPGNAQTYAGWRIGVINDYEYYGPISDYITANASDSSIVQYVSGKSPLEQNLRKLRAGRLDMVAEVTAVLAYALKGSGLSDEVEIIPTTTESPVYIGFSPTMPAAEVYKDQLDDGTRELRRSGRLAEILARYAMEDWVK